MRRGESPKYALDWRASNGSGHSSILILISRFKAITHPWLGKDVFRSAKIELDLFSQLPHKDSQVIRLFDAIASPNGTEACPVR